MFSSLIGAVRITDDRTFSCGNRIPTLAQNKLVQAPPATITVSQAMRPRSVTTPATRPAARSMPRTAHCANITAPLRCAARAMAGAAFCGSARPSQATYSAQR